MICRRNIKDTDIRERSINDKRERLIIKRNDSVNVDNLTLNIDEAPALPRVVVCTRLAKRVSAAVYTDPGMCEVTYMVLKIKKTI